MRKMNIDLKIRKERRNTIARRILYFVIAALFYILMTTVKFSGAVPLILIPAAVGAAVFESSSPVYCAFYGCFCGLLLDRASGTLISFNGIIIGFCAMMTALVFCFYLHKKLLNFLLLDLAAVLVQGLLHYLFFYLMWGYDGGGRIFSDVFVPEFIVTNISGAAVYGLFFLLNRFLGNVREHYIEDNPGGGSAI